MQNAFTAANCSDINWATWPTFNSRRSITGNILDADGSQINITMSANYDFDSTPGIYNHSRLSSYPSPIPNATVPKTTWSAGTGGVTTMCFSKKVTNPVLLLASLGSSAPISSRLNFSVPYIVLHDGGGMVYNSIEALTGTEGYAVIMFPGELDCVTIHSNTNENYTNITWGIRPQPFTVNLIAQPGTCGSAVLTATGGVSYKWSGGDTPNQATNTFHESGLYVVTVTGANGCVTAASRALAISSPFTPTIINSATNCGSVSYTAIGGSTYLRSGGNSPNSATNTFVNSGIYSVTITNSEGCQATLTQNVVVPTPTTNNIIASNNTAICSGQGSNIIINGNQPDGYTPATAYSWQHSLDNTSWTNIVGATQQNYQVTDIITQSFYIRRLTSLDNCLAYSNVIQISLQPAVTTASAGPNQTLCAQQHTALAANTTLANETGTWSVISPAGYNPFNAANLHNPAATITNLPVDVNIQLKWTVLKTTCGQQSESTVNIINLSKPIITNFTLAEQTEAASIDQLAGTITVWVNPNTNLDQLTPGIAITNGTVTPAAGTPVNFSSPVNYTLSNGCLTNVYKVIIKPVQANAISACGSVTNLLLPGQVTTPGAVYEWQQFNNSWQPVANSGSSKDYLAVPTTNQPSTVQKVLYRCKVTTGNMVTYIPYYEASFYPQITGSNVTGDKQFICYGDNGIITFTGNAPLNVSPGTTIAYQWLRSTDNVSWQIISGATQQNYTYSSVSNQTVYFRRQATAGGCDDFSNAIRLEYGAPPTAANAGADQLACPDQAVKLNANTVAVDETGSWSVVSPASYQPFNQSNINNPSATITNLPLNTNVVIRWTIKKQQCAGVSQSDITVRANSLPVVDAGKNTVIEIGKSITLNGNITGSYNSFEWLPATGLNNSKSLTPVASPLVNTQYTLKVTTTAGCIVTAVVSIIVNIDLSIPNTFTPNNDGINDVWNINNLKNFNNVTVDIYNRYGTPVYHSRGYASPWNGTTNGKKLPKGVYYYVIRVHDVDLKKAGSITVLY